MGKYEDFDLDLNKIKDKSGDTTPDALSLGTICTLISGVIIGSIVTGCSDKCVTTNCSAYICQSTEYCVDTI